MLHALENASSQLSVRYIDNKKNPELQDELRIHGAEKVPVVVCLSEDFFEVSRFGDNHLNAYRHRAKTTLGPACDPGILPPSENVLAEELGEWVNFFDRVQLLLRTSPMLRERYKD